MGTPLVNLYRLCRFLLVPQTYLHMYTELRQRLGEASHTRKDVTMLYRIAPPPADSQNL